MASFTTQLIEDIAIALVVIIIAYILLSMILAFCWNRSITPMFGHQAITWTNALFLILTLHILLGTFTNTAMALFTNKVSNLETQIQSQPQAQTQTFLPAPQMQATAYGQQRAMPMMTSGDMRLSSQN